MTGTPPRAITVLLVEDSPGDARLILELLREAATYDFELERVDRLEGAIDRLRRTGIDAVLLDLGLPDSQGIDTFARTQHGSRGEPIIVISGVDDERLALEAVRRGAQDYLVKGRIDAQLLAKVICYAIERKRAEAALTLSEAHYRTILENVVDGIVVSDAEGRIIDVNSRASEMTMYSKEEMVDQNVLDICVPEDRGAVTERFRKLQRGTNVPFEGRLLRRSGEVIIVEGHSVRLPDGKILTTARDITERRRADEQIRESERRFRELAESVREVFFIMDPTGRSLYVNPAYETVFGQSRDHAYRTPNAWMERIHPDDLPAAAVAERETASAGTSKPITFRLLHPDGSTRWIRGSAVPVRDDKGTIIRIVGIAEDVSDLKQAEEQLRHSQKMEAVGRLAGGVAHDFNNLLTAILSYAELLLTELEMDSPLRNDVDEILQAGVRAAGLTRQLLAFSRQQVLHPTVLSPNSVVDGVERMLRRLIGEDVVLDTRLASDLGNVRADAGQLEQVLMNLAINARDAMPDGGTLTIETANVLLTNDYADAHQPVEPGSYVMLAVSDTGTGMDRATVERIFEPFFTTKEAGKGTGLGLSTVYGIVQQFGGSIWVYSELGRGTTFKIYLPRSDEPAEAPMASTGTSGIPVGTETILLAEDDEQLRKLVSGFLGRIGYQVLAAETGGEALRLAADHGGPIQLLLTDVVMPGLNGREVSNRLGAVRPDLRTLFMSGYTDAAIVHHGILEPGIEYLQKPFTPSVLARRVREVLDRSRPQTG
jgi:PAS domain S-box-containing protein